MAESGSTAPAHVGVEGNEHADVLAKRAAEGEEGRASPEYLGEASLSHLMRMTTEARSGAAREWIRGHVRRERRYPPPPGGKLCKGLGKARKGLAGRFYQLLSGHAATAPSRADQPSPKRQVLVVRQRLKTNTPPPFIRRRRWTPEIRGLWQRVERDCEWESPRAPSIRLLFRDGRATPAVLEFLEDTRVGKIPSFGCRRRSRIWRR